ncbi:MAG: hypothetical protein QOH90_934, partial [Actinomycetota bacterium]|nr:hypothetical protein [Actinomycetota bacterium]
FGIGAALKMYPIVFLAPLVLERWWARDRKGAVVAGGAGLATTLAINLPFMIANGDGWLATYTFHKERFPNFDSIWWLGFPHWGPDQFNEWTTLLLLGTGLVCLGVGILQARRRGIYPFLEVCGALLATFLLWNKVHSPQYTLWLLPFFVLLRVNVAWWVAYALADLAVYVGVFRYFYDFGQGNVDHSGWKTLMTVGVWTRAALLLGLIVVFLRSRPSWEAEATAPPAKPSEGAATVATA